MRRIWLFMPLLLILITGFSPGKTVYPADEIPEELKNGAVAVIREHRETFTVKSIDKATREVYHAVTILSENGDDYALFREWYDKLRSIYDISIEIYDARGEVLKKVKSSEIEDYSAFSSFSIYEDNRQKIYEPLVKNYPFTVVVSFKQDYKGLFVFPAWQPVEGYDQSVESSSFEIVMPYDLKLRYKSINLAVEPEVNPSGTETSYTWSTGQIPAIESESHSPFFHEIAGVLLTAPSDFSIEGFTGNMETWESMGKWAWSLLEGRGSISDKTISEVHNLVADTDDIREITRRVYKYMQQKTRYVSIQEGIGGWQPMPALMVDELGYGDCKALSNYTVALLREAGVEAYYTKVRAGRVAADMIPDFVSNQSNHIIVCVPAEGDTIWLECTSQVSPFGYIGNFTDDRNVLLVTPEGGLITRTRRYTAEDNTQVHIAEVDLSDPSMGKVSVSSSYRGLQYDNVSGLLRQSATEREKWLYSNYDMGDYKLGNFRIDEYPPDRGVPGISTSLEASLSGYVTETGNRLFIPLNLLNRTDYVPPRYRDRKCEVVLNYPFTDIDSVSYSLPAGYRVESCPEDVDIESPFGHFSAKVSIDEDKVLYVRKRVMYKGRFPAESYDDFRQFYREKSRADAAKLVLISE